MTMASSKVAPPIGDAAPHNGFSLISNDKLLQIYGTMLRCRMLQARMHILAKQNGSIGAGHTTGQEAQVAGIALDLLPGDTLAPSPGGWIPCFVKGLPLSRILSAHSLGNLHVRTRFAPFNLIPPSLSLGAQLERALNAAKVNKASRNKSVAVAFCGDSPESAGILHQAMRRAGRLNLPILLVCRNGSNADEICRQAEAFGFPGVTVDCDDAVAIYRVATEAMAHARRGSRPTLIECRPWTLSGQRSVGRQTSSDPILKMEKYLATKGLFDSRLKAAVTRSFRLELDAAT